MHCSQHLTADCPNNWSSRFCPILGNLKDASTRLNSGRAPRLLATASACRECARRHASMFTLPVDRATRSTIPVIPLTLIMVARSGRSSTRHPCASSDAYLMESRSRGIVPDAHRLASMQNRTNTVNQITAITARAIFHISEKPLVHRKFNPLQELRLLLGGFVWYNLNIGVVTTSWSASAWIGTVKSAICAKRLKLQRGRSSVG